MMICHRRRNGPACLLVVCALAAERGIPSAGAFAPPPSASNSVHRSGGPLPARGARPLAAFRADDSLRVDAGGEPQSDGIISPEGDGDDNSPAAPGLRRSENDDSPSSWLTAIWGKEGALFSKPPPFIVDDTNLLFYDVALLLNLSLSISFWVVHRMSFFHVGSALSEGSLLCIVWIASGLYYGAFLHSAVDGHRGGIDDDGLGVAGGGGGGPKAAGLLGLSTFVGACNLRIVVALAQAVWEHRPVGVTDGEKLIPLEFAVGLVLMSAWRALHSYYTPRI